ncbi:MAG TPA: hypothetical protein VF613_07730 [Longimicrobium sp.]|jgi:hypothetical protein
MLAETDAPLSLLLWQRARDVRLWALAGEGSRAGLFTGGEPVESALEVGEGLADSLVGPLRALGALARYPEFITGADLCVACLAISEWAEREHMTETALHYAEAAALADPSSARAAAWPVRLALGWRRINALKFGSRGRSAPRGAHATGNGTPGRTSVWGS